MGLTYSQVLSILKDPDNQNSSAKARHKAYPNVPQEERKQLSELFWKRVGPPPDDAELRRTTNSVRNRKESLLTRIRGERIKQSKASDGRRLNGLPSRPSERDECIFKMVSILVRQEGFTKSDAIDRVASSEGWGVNRDEILNSVERVWRYDAARAKRMQLQMPDAKSYWQPGLLRYKC